MRTLPSVCAAIVCLALPGCWDFPQSRYNQDGASLDTDTSDLKIDGPRQDKQKIADKAKPPLDKAKPPLDKAKPPLDKAKPPLDKAKPPLDKAKPPLDKPKPPVDKPKPPVDMPKPPVDMPKPPVDMPPPPPDQKVLLPKGAKCGKASDCQSSICAQGRCCGSPCAGKCMACDLAGQEGNCAPVPPGKDPHNSCNPDPVSTCGQDGNCDGKGQCQKYGPGTVCAPGTCASDKVVMIKHCDGAGNCNPAPDKSCFPYKCDPASKQCHASCTSGNQNATCSGYYACFGAKNTCYSSCSSDNHCKSNGECNKSSKKCKKD